MTPADGIEPIRSLITQNISIRSAFSRKIIVFNTKDSYQQQLAEIGAIT